MFAADQSGLIGNYLRGVLEIMDRKLNLIVLKLFGYFGQRALPSARYKKGAKLYV